mgnify:CR=1 FL=1
MGNNCKYLSHYGFNSLPCGLYYQLMRHSNLNTLSFPIIKDTSQLDPLGRYTKLTGLIHGQIWSVISVYTPGPLRGHAAFPD